MEPDIPDAQADPDPDPDRDPDPDGAHLMSEEERIDEASRESFPASDPPAY